MQKELLDVIRDVHAGRKRIGQEVATALADHATDDAEPDGMAHVAATEATTCLQGESGTGQEVIARFIYKLSPRWRGPFIAINCAALPAQLLESELFGFERGAFTGAQQSKPGQIELAAGGILFLDEVTEMTPAAQAKSGACSRSASSCDWAAPGRSASTSASSPLPIEI